MTTTADEDGTGQRCALREAIKAANGNAAYGGCPAGSGTDTITFPSQAQQTYNITLAADVIISSPITIAGGNHLFRGTQSSGGFSILAGSSARVSHVKVTGFGRRSPFRVKGFLELKESEIHDNVSTGIPPQTLGIWVDATGSLYASNSVLRGNSAIKGGGVYNVGGRVKLTNVAIVNNTSSQYGGGVMTTEATADTEIVNCTISGNTAVGWYGGGVFNGVDASTTIYNTTIVNNKAAKGGGIWMEDSIYGSLAIRNTIVANNTATLDTTTAGCRGRIYTWTGNLIGTNACSLTAFGAPTPNAPDVLNVVSVKLGALQTVGGGIQLAHPPQFDSPAVDRIHPDWRFSSHDQINNPRPRGVKSDIGAIER
ncbi:MAG TPA: choice-of-anchor Q domain-containing protein [Polyangia bacterium]